MGIKLRWYFGRAPRPVGDDEGGCIVVEGTGEAVEANGGSANTGYSGPPLRRGQKVVVKNTGDATASGPGSRANSGIDWT